MSLTEWFRRRSASQQTKPATGRKYQPRLLELEERSVPATFVVTNVLDNGFDINGGRSLRQAIIDANANPGFDRIVFDIPTQPSVVEIFSIRVETELPAITDPAGVAIDATTQPGFALNKGRPVVEITGAFRITGTVAQKADDSGLTIAGSDVGLPSANNLIRGLTINSFPFAGINIVSSNNNIIVGNLIGPDSDGGSANYFLPPPQDPTLAPSAKLFGGPNKLFQIAISGGSQGNIIGGIADVKGDVLLDAGGRLLGEPIVDGAKTYPVGSASMATHRNYLGGTQEFLPGDEVYGIAGLPQTKASFGVGPAIRITGTGTYNNLVQGNAIGQDFFGKALPNYNGIEIFANANSNTIGNPTDPTAGNVIRFNQHDGIRIAANPFPSDTIAIGGLLTTTGLQSGRIVFPVFYDVFEPSYFQAKDNLASQLRTGETARGVRGTEFVVSGSNFTNVSEVRIESTDANGNFTGTKATAKFEIISNTSMVITIPETAKTGFNRVVAKNLLGDSPPLIGLNIQVSPAPIFLQFAAGQSTPLGALGSTNRGDRVQVRGNGLLGTTGVTVGGVPTVFDVIDDTEMFITVPFAAVDGPQDVVITTAGGVVTAGVNRTTTLRGAGFTGVTNVSLLGQPVTFTVVNDSELTVNIPATLPDGITPLPNGTYQFIVAGPNITGGTAVFTGVVSHLIVLPQIPTAINVVQSTDTVIGQTLKIFGQGFLGASNVSIGGINATFTVDLLGGRIEARIPDGLALNTPHAVVVNTPAGAATAPAPITLRAAPAPTLLGYQAAGVELAKVGIIGSNLIGTQKVIFLGKAGDPADDKEATFTVVSNTELFVTVPVGAKTGPVQLSTPSGDAFTTDLKVGPTSFTVVATAAAKVAGLTQPNSGTVGSVVTIAGDQLWSSTLVFFNLDTGAQVAVAASKYQIEPIVDASALDGRLVGGGESLFLRRESQIRMRVPDLPAGRYNIYAINQPPPPPTNPTFDQLSQALPLAVGKTVRYGEIFVVEPSPTLTAGTLSATTGVRGSEIVRRSVNGNKSDNTTPLADPFVGDRKGQWLSENATLDKTLKGQVTITPTLGEILNSRIETGAGVVTISNGSGYTSVQSVTVGGKEASFTIIDDTKLNFIVPNVVGTNLPVVVRTKATDPATQKITNPLTGKTSLIYGGSELTVGNFTVTAGAAPNITGVAPQAFSPDGVALAGAPTFITGTNFIGTTLVQYKDANGKGPTRSVAFTVIDNNTIAAYTAEQPTPEPPPVPPPPPMTPPPPPGPPPVPQGQFIVTNFFGTSGPSSKIDMEDSPGDPNLNFFNLESGVFDPETSTPDNPVPFRADPGRTIQLFGGGLIGTTFVGFTYPGFGPAAAGPDGNIYAPAAFSLDSGGTTLTIVIPSNGVTGDVNVFTPYQGNDSIEITVDTLFEAQPILLTGLFPANPTNVRVYTNEIYDNGPNDLAGTQPDRGINFSRGDVLPIITNDFAPGLNSDLDIEFFTPFPPPGAQDYGPNRLQNFPLIQIGQSTIDRTEIPISIRSQAFRTYRIDLFTNSPATVALNPQSTEDFLGTIFITTDATGFGNANFIIQTGVDPRAPLPVSTNLVAVATDLTLGETATPNSIQTTPSGDGSSRISFNQTVTTSTGAITGKAFNDLNGNGKLDTGESGIAGWTVQLDLDNNGTIDAVQTTAVDGSYAFSANTLGLGLPNGTHSVIMIPSSAGWLPINPTTSKPAPTPPNSSQLVTIANGDQPASNFFFVRPGESTVQFEVSDYTVFEAAGQIVVTVTRTATANDLGALLLPATVDFATAPGSALDGIDYTGTKGTLQFLAGQKSATITIPIVNDGLVETNETFTVELSNAKYDTSLTAQPIYPNDPYANTTIGAIGKTTITITDPPSFKFSAASYTVDENAGLAFITVERFGSLTGTAKATFATSAGTATPGTDYTETTGTLTFLDGQATATFSVPILTDSDVEGTETVNLSLTPPVGGGLGTPGTATLNITDPVIPPVPPPPAVFNFSAATYTVAETGKAATITVNRTGDLTTAVTVNYATADISATAGADYTGVTGTLSFAASQGSATFVIPVLTDNLFESNEQVRLTLSAPAPTTGATLGTTFESTLTITDVPPNLPPIPPIPPGPPVIPPPPISPPPVPPPPGVGGTPAGRQGLVATGSGILANNYEFINGQAVQKGSSFTPFPGRAGFVRAATGDFNFDGVADTVYVTGPGGGAFIRITSGVDGADLLNGRIVDTFPGEDLTNIGLFVTTGDIDADGKDEIAISADQGGGPRVKIYSLVNGQLSQRQDFLGIEDPNFRGGARIALGDLNGDRRADLAVGAGFQGGPRIALYDGSTLFNTRPVKFVGDFFVFEPDPATGLPLLNGVYVAAGDMDGDGKAELAFGGGPGGGPRVQVLRFADIQANVEAAKANSFSNFFVFDSGARGGVRPVIKDIDFDGKLDLVAANGDNGAPLVKTFLGKNFAGDGTGPSAEQQLFAAFADPALANGVFVG